MYELPTYYLLPLIGLNFKNFGNYKSGQNLKTVKLDIPNLKVLCTVRDLSILPRAPLQAKNYLETLEPNVLVFKFPKVLAVTLDAFIKGNYSKIPNSIKKHIISNSGLPKDHDYMLALNSPKKLKLKLEEELDVTLEDTAELLEAPKKEWFLV